MRKKRNWFYKLWLFLEIMTVKRLLLTAKDSKYFDLLYLSKRYDDLVGELKNII